MVQSTTRYCYSAIEQPSIRLQSIIYHQLHQRQESQVATTKTRPSPSASRWWFFYLKKKRQLSIQTNGGKDDGDDAVEKQTSSNRANVEPTTKHFCVLRRVHRLMSWESGTRSSSLRGSSCSTKQCCRGAERLQTTHHRTPAA